MRSTADKSPPPESQMPARAEGNPDGAGPEGYRWLLGRLDRTRRYLRAVLCVQSLLQALVVLLIVAPALFLLDNWLHFSMALRVVGFLAIVSLCLAVFLNTIRVAFQQWSYERLAVKIEGRFPELENRLINVVQISALNPEASSEPLLAEIVGETVQQTSSCKLRKAVDTKSLKRTTLMGFLLALLVITYAFFLPDYFGNAAWRIFFPIRGDLMPLTRIAMKIDPGDTTINKGDNLTVSAMPTSEALPRDAKLQVRDDNGSSQFLMDNDGSAFLYELSEIAKDLRYRVKGGDYVSAWYEVRVVEKPRIERLSVRYRYPAYTGLSPATMDPSNGNLKALIGTRATLTAWTNKPLQSAHVRLSSNKEILAAERPAPIETSSKKTAAEEDQSETLPLLEIELTLEKNDSYQWILKDPEGYDNAPALIHTIQATSDAPPRVAITLPIGEVDCPKGQDLDILYSASDDYGLASLSIRMDYGKENAQSKILRQNELKPFKKTLRDGYVLHTDSPEFQVGEQVRLSITVTDTDPLKTAPVVSEPLIIHIVAPPREADQAARDSENILSELQRLLDEQRRLKSDLEKWRMTLQGINVTPQQRETILGKILLDQSTLRSDALALAESTSPDSQQDKVWTQIRADLQTLADAEMRQAVAAIEQLTKIEDIQKRRDQVDTARPIQSAIIKRLEELLGAMSAAPPDPEETPPFQEEEPEDTRPPRPSISEDLHGAALDFREDIKDAVKTLQNMEDVNPEDLSTEQTQALEDLAEKEEEWAEYFKDAADWLRQSAMVESTESGLRDELIEIYSEIHLLPEEMRHAPITIEVETPSGGGELAEELTTELEKWLAEEPDFRKWVMENAPEDYEVPLADLPDELTDMIGDLLESEEDMTEAIEDMTSNLADSLDKGAGWEAMDGPISNYSAKGVTGNILPNDMDISGRAGEGRTGRSLGEMVENVATGKGGRDTKTRMTDDAMGDGQIEDLSTEQTGGVTGGGKIAGTSGYGLASPTAPQQPELIQDLVQKQADIRQKAVSLQSRLMNLQFQGANLDSSIRAMEQIEKSLQTGQYNNLKDLGALALSDLVDQKRVTREQFRIRRDPNASKSRKLQHDVRQGPDEEFPDEYRTLLSAYYEALSREGMDE